MYSTHRVEYQKAHPLFEKKTVLGRPFDSYNIRKNIRFCILINLFVYPTVNVSGELYEDFEADLNTFGRTKAECLGYRKH